MAGNSYANWIYRAYIRYIGAGAVACAGVMIFSTWGGRISLRTQQYRLDHQGRLFDM